VSRYWNLRCIDHDEPLLDDTWNHGDDHLAQLWHSRDALVKVLELAPPELDLYNLEWDYRRLPYRTFGWLKKHGGCRVELLDEYGVTKDPESMEPTPPHHCSTCTCPPGTTTGGVTS
jgi:hypothetical protein